MPKQSALQISECPQQLGWLLKALLDAAGSSDKTWVQQFRCFGASWGVVAKVQEIAFFQADLARLEANHEA